MGHREMEQEFLSHYRILEATTPDLLDEVYRVRYEVYCQNLRYEDPSRYPDRREYDHHDRHSVHCLLQERKSKRFIGCVRMILADASEPQRKLPFESVFDPHSDGDIPLTNRDSLAEVSRLAVVYPHQSKGNVLKSVDKEFARHTAFIGFGLYLAAIGIVIDQGLENMFAMMEPRLSRLLKRYGILFQQVGDVIDFHGRRAPFHVTTGSLMENLAPEMCRLLARIMQEMQRRPEPWAPPRHPGIPSTVETDGRWASSMDPGVQAAIA